MISSIFGFYLMAGVIGLVQGGVQSVSRAVFSKMVPEGKDSEFFGFYNLSWKICGNFWTNDGRPRKLFF